MIAYLQRANLPLLRINHPDVPMTDAEIEPARRRSAGAGRWSVIGVLVALTPLGLLAPGGAFGEDAPDDLDLGRYGLDAVPSGLRHYAGFWHHAVFDGYGFADDAHPRSATCVGRRRARRDRASSSSVPSAIGAVCAATRPAADADDAADRRRELGHGRHARPGCCSRRSGCARADASAGGARAASWPRRSNGGGGAAAPGDVLRATSRSAPGLLQRIEPRVKLLTTFGLLVATALVRNIPVLVGLYAVTLVLAVASALPLGFFVRRVWLFIPDLHRDHRHPGDVQRDHRRHDRRAARHLVRPAASA